MKETITNITGEIDILMASIQNTETQISQLSTGALADANRVLNQVKKIESDVTLALETAKNTVQVGCFVFSLTKVLNQIRNKIPLNIYAYFYTDWSTS